MDVVKRESLGPPLVVDDVEQPALNLHLAVHPLSATHFEQLLYSEASATVTAKKYHKD